jgi:hypothetical protein
MMVTIAGWRLEHTCAGLPQLFYSHAAPTVVCGTSPRNPQYAPI